MKSTITYLQRLSAHVWLLVTALCLAGCHQVEEWDNDAMGNFEALWTIVDQHYCFFAEKDINWQAIHDQYAAQVSPAMTSTQLFGVCADMLNQLRDGHTNLSSGFTTSYYRAWWSDYPQNYDQRLIQQYYLLFDYRQLGGVSYGILPQNVGYVRYPSFATTLGHGNIDHILDYLKECSALIIDIRDNGGGEMTNVERWVGHLITQRTLAGYMQHKTGPGHNDFSEPRAYYYNPVTDGHLIWQKPLVVLTNRSTFSAANNFVSIMKYQPNVTIVGARTGGGSGMPFSSELPNGWGVRFSACPVLDPAGLPTEMGIDPTEGCTVDMDPEKALQGHDTILDFAVDFLTKQP